MHIRVLDDPLIKAMPEYGAEDVYRALEGERHELASMEIAALGRLRREEVDLLILPYLNGEIPEKALEAMVRFHEQGGGMLVLGQLPHRARWAPTRNFHGYRFHLTAYCGPGQVDGLSDRGRELLGELPDLDRFAGKQIGCGRTTAFPPDVTVPLFVSNDPQLQWESTPGVWIERKGTRFLGARFAQIACMGGEPRERAAGGYPMEWTHDPGLLTREWPGMDVLLRRLVAAMRPLDWAASLNIPPLHKEDAPGERKLWLRNLSLSNLTAGPFDLRIEQEVRQIEVQTLSPGELREISLAEATLKPGVTQWELWQGNSRLQRVNERILPAGVESAQTLGFGFSTYWAFQSPEVPQEFITFCAEMKKRGCQYVRVNLPWEDVEPRPGTYDWRIPDAYVRIADQLGLHLMFWMFPITRGATIGDAGVPEWVLKEPALTHDGRTGFFPSLWSPYYRKHYFGMIDALSKRYADCDCLDRFIIDFGNSDFSYGYFYYVNSPTLFDYSVHERKAFAQYLVKERKLSLKEISALYREHMVDESAIPVPLESKHPGAWRVYLDFRAWSIRVGLEEIRRIVASNAPDKLPRDLPGHGSGSIADLNSFHLESKAKHWQEESAYPPELTRLHNAGPNWGGEPWQVGSRFEDLDDALFQSIRLGSDYFSIAGPDIGVYGDDISRAGYIRRWLQGAERAPARIAVIDRCEWNAFQSLAHVAARMDQAVDMLSSRHRYDFSCYDLLALPPNERHGNTQTDGGGSRLLPPDREWYENLRSSIEKGLNVILYPETARVRPDQPVPPPLRQILNLRDVGYGPRIQQLVHFTEEIGGGSASGNLRTVQAEGEVVLRNEEGQPILIKRPLGRGAIWLAGWDTEPDSLDGPLSPESTRCIRKHSLCRLASALGITSTRIRTGQIFLYKEWIRNPAGEAFLAFSHASKPIKLYLSIHLDQPSKEAVDLSTGEIFRVTSTPDGWSTLSLEVFPKKGRYLWFRPACIRD